MAVGAVGASRLVGLGGSGLAVTLSTASVVLVVFLSPLVVIGPDLATVLLVFVAPGVNRVVRLAPSGVSVDTVGLLGPVVVVVLSTRGNVPGGGIVLLLGTVGGVSVVAVALGAVSVATVSTVVGSVVGGLAVAVVVSGGGGPAVGGGTVGVLVLSPSLSTFGVVVLVVIFVVRLS